MINAGVVEGNCWMGKDWFENLKVCLKIIMFDESLLY